MKRNTHIMLYNHQKPEKILDTGYKDRIHVVKETNIAVLQFETISLPLIDSRVEWNQPQPRGGKACV